MVRCRPAAAFLLVILMCSLDLGALAAAPAGPPASDSLGSALPAAPAPDWDRPIVKQLIGAQGSERLLGSKGAGEQGSKGTREEGSEVAGGEGSGSAGGQAEGAKGRAGVDVAPVNIDYVGPNPVTREFGAAEVGKPTQFNVTVSNLGNIDSGSVAVGIRISDYFRNVIGQYSTSIPSLAAGASQTVYWKYWTPTYSTVFSVNATATATGDTNDTNDVLILSGLMVEKWLDACDVVDGWTGDIAADRWHLTTSVYNDPNPGFHSSPSTWWCGLGTQYYGNMDSSLVSPPLDLRRFNRNYYALFNFNYYGRTVDQGDRLETHVSDDDGATWMPLFANLQSGNAQGGWFSWVSHWVDYNGNGLVDPNEPHQDGLDISKFIGRLIRVKFRFVSDETANDVGFYLDDFTLRGIEDQNDVAVLRIASAGVERLDVEQAYTTTIQNLGQNQQPAFKAHFNVSDGTSQSQTVPQMAPGQVVDLAWRWTPAAAGNFTIACSIAPGQDEVAQDNYLERPVHIASGRADTLLVDDDSGPGNNGALRLYDSADVEAGIMGALTFTDYDSYLVADDAAGPPLGTLNDYGLVVWLTGYDDSFVSRTGTLAPGDRQNLSGYLEGGGRLWLISFEAMWDTWVVHQDTIFTMKYLHVRTFADYEDDAGMPSPLDGVPEDPITDGFHFDTSLPPTGLWDKSDRISNDSSAPGIFFQYSFVKDTLTGPFNALRYSGNFKLVFLAFEFTFIRDPEDRGLLARKALEWMWKGAYLQAGPGGLARDIVPGGRALYNLSLVNPEPRRQSLDYLRPAPGPSGWNATSTPSVENGSPAVEIGPLATLGIVLEVECPPSAPAGNRASILLFARMAGSPFSFSIATTTTVLAVAGVRLDCPESAKSVTGGDEAVFTVQVKNIGNYDNRVNLTLSGEAAGWAELSRNSLFLSAGGRAYVQVVANVSREALAGSYNLSLRAAVWNGTALLSDSLDLVLLVNATRFLKIENVPASTSVNLARSQNARISVVISNYGNQPETAQVSLRAGFGQATEWTLPVRSLSLAPFEKLRTVDLDVGIPATAPAGPYDLKVRLAYSSGDEAENRAIVINVLRPDLSLSPEDVEITPARPGLQENIEITAMVRNRGGAVQNVNVTFYLNDRPIGSCIIAEDIPDGGAAPATLFHRGLRYGENLLRVVVDPQNAILEVSKLNNEVNLTVRGYEADLYPGTITFREVGKGPTPSNISVPAGMVEISVVIANQGQYCLDVENAEVNFTIDGDFLDTRVVVSLTANSEAEVIVVWVAKPGTHRIGVRVDPGNRTGEVDEANNEATLTVEVAGPATSSAGLSGDQLLLVAGVAALALVAGLFFYQSWTARKEATAGRTWPSGKPDAGGEARTEIAQGRGERTEIVRAGGAAAAMRIYSAKAGRRLVCGRCGRPIPEGEEYFKCGCDTRYHLECAPEGRCPKCAAADDEE